MPSARSWSVPSCIRVQRQLLPNNINQCSPCFHCSFQEVHRRPALALAEEESSLDFSLDKSGMTSGDSGGPGWLGYWATGCCTRSRSAKL